MMSVSQETKSKRGLTDGQHRTPREDVEWHGLLGL
jgi:hypothetical protein